MANEIDLVVGSVAFKQITDLLVELGKVDGEIKKIGESAIKMNTALGVKNTADLTKLSAENAKLNKEIEKLIGSAAVLETKLANLATAQAKTAKATTDAAIAEEKLITATNKNTVAVERKTKATLEETIAQREATNAKTLEIKAGQGLAQTYAELDARHKQAVKLAQDLAVATGRSTKEYENAKNKANELGARLRVIDTDIGKHTRNVGNYSSSWNGLGNSINQLTREAPAFANSVQTGFMALSNNIPILTDELGVLIQKNKDLQANGKPTESILKTVAGAFFSWQTAISLGVTILTVYGAKLVDMALGLGDVKKELDKLDKSQKIYNNNLKNTTEEILRQAQLQKDEVTRAHGTQKAKDAIDEEAKRKILKNNEIYRDARKKQLDDEVKTALQRKGLYLEGYEVNLDGINRYEKERNRLTKHYSHIYRALTKEENDELTDINQKYKKEQKRVDALNTNEVVNRRKKLYIEQNNEAITAGTDLTSIISRNSAAQADAAFKAQEKIKNAKPEKERVDLKFDELKSLNDLDQAKLKSQKVDLQSLDIDTMTTDEKIINRLELSEIIKKDIASQEKEAKDASNKKMADDLERNRVRLANDKSFAEQSALNIIAIEKTNKNELAAIQLEASDKYKELKTSDDKFIKKLNDADLKSSQELSIKKLDAEILADKMIYEDKEKGKKQTLKDREAAFQEFLSDAEKRIAVQEEIAMTEAGADPIKQEAVRENFKALRLELTKIISPAEQAKEAVDGFFRDSFDKSMNNSLEALGMSSLKTFLDFDKNGQSSFMKMMDSTDSLAEKSAIAFQVIGDAAQGMFNTINESSQASFDAEYARLEKQKEISLKFAGDSSVAKEKIEADYAAKKKEIQLREFKQKQKMSLANIAIDTAQAIVSIWAQVPKVDFGVSATALSIFVGALGAIQAGMVLAQKPPAYAEGTDNHSGGLMLVNDGAGSNYQEKVILPSGKVIRPQGRNVLMDAPKGTKVLNHEQQLFEMLQSNNISMSSQGNSGLTYDEMNEIFQNNFANIKTQNTIFDKNGFQSYVKNGNSITRSNSNRSQAIGISV